MRNSTLVVCVLMALSSIARAAPSTQPLISVDDIPVPGPRAPAAAVAVAPTPPPPVAPAGSRVVILPFESLGDVDRRDWVVRAVQESLSTEAARLGGIFVFSASTPLADKIDTAAARQAANAYNGDFVIFGACQFVDTDLRITGQIVDVKTGGSIAGLKASGDLRDLFALEDQLTNELARALRPPPAPPQPALALARAQNNSAIFTNQPPPLTADDLYTPFDPSVLYASAYNRYYYASPYLPDFYGGYGYGFIGGYFGPGLSYSGFGTGGFRYHRNFPDIGNHPSHGAN
jgi:TolB-like protein